ncbi:hypothetical protein AAMO2058_000187200 [Amorphochlora amoebiformis]
METFERNYAEWIPTPGGKHLMVQTLTKSSVFPSFRIKFGNIHSILKDFGWFGRKLKTDRNPDPNPDANPNFIGFESLSTIGVIRILGVPSKKLFMQAALIGLLNTLAFVTSIWAITKTALWISMSLCNVDCAFNLILSVLFLGENCSIAKVSGMSLTVVGGTLLAVSGAMTRNSNKASNSLEGDIASIIYALELSVLMVAWKKFLSKFTWSLLFTINGLAGVFEVLIILPILIWAYSTGFEGKGWDSPATVVAMCLLNGLVHLALSLWWSFCIGYTSPTYVSVAGVMIIPVTTLADYFQFRFKLQWMDALATVIILAGFLVTRHGYAQSSNDSTSPDEAAEIHDKPNERDSDRSLLEGASLRDDARHSLLSVDDRKAKMGASEALLGS